MCGALTHFPISLRGAGVAGFIGTTDRERLVSFALSCSKYRGWMGLALKGCYFPQACKTSPGIVQVMVVLEVSHRVVSNCSYETSEQTFFTRYTNPKKPIT